MAKEQQEVSVAKRTFKCVYIDNGQIYVNGRAVDSLECLSKLDNVTVTIRIDGNVKSVVAENCSCVNILGNVGSVETDSGDVICYDVKKGIRTVSGAVQCQRCYGDLIYENPQKRGE